LYFGQGITHIRGDDPGRCGSDLLNAGTPFNFFLLPYRNHEKNVILNMIISILNNEFLTCELDDTLPVLRHRWKRATDGEAFRSNLLKVLDEYKKLKDSYSQLAWLADTTLLGELDEETEHWLVDVWEDLLFGKRQVKIHAVILGNSIFADYPMENFKQDAERKFQSFDVHLGVFSNHDEAYLWIREKQLSISKDQ
jgi:hypothetical protein